MQHMQIHHVLSVYGTTEHFAVANQYNQPCNTQPPSCIAEFNTQQRGIFFSTKIGKQNICLAGGAWAVMTDVGISLVLCACAPGESLASVCLHWDSKPDSQPANGWSPSLAELAMINWNPWDTGLSRCKWPLVTQKWSLICIKERVQLIIVCCYKQEERRKAQKLAQVNFTKRRRLGRSQQYFFCLNPTTRMLTNV